ncbi:site-specific DNA-methyltransferase, partial [Globicatella sulfidifaciens]|uniref:site-specific DNA-methyltransferase n=1 Tax=Globicatella sulfidifaciens TaxID=136093 RepID=UPI0023F527A7
DIEDQNIEKLLALFPEVNTDGKIDFEKLKQILGEYVDDSEERYRFVWNGKGEALRLSQTPSMGTLRPAKEEGESKNWDETENLYIEGDNLEVLKLLQKSYFNKIKMIYIDPPYNTGGDFVYKDNFKDNIQNYKKITGQIDSEGNATSTNREYSGRYHTDWLNMMYPRLRLARNLLTDDGIIFISIDDNELHNMKKICDEVYGENNFIEIFSWQKTSTPPNLSYKTKKSLEYILAYQKKSCENLKGLIKYSASTNGLMNQSNNIGVLKFPKDKTLTSMKNESFQRGVYGTESYKIELLNDVEVINGKFNDDVILRGRFKWSQKYLEEQLNNNVKIYIKTNVLSPSYDKEEYEAEKPWNLIDRTFNVGTNVNASDEVDKLFFVNFSDNLYPKPVSLIKYLLKMINLEDSIVLDFFSGSSTTAHATMELNAEDNGNRKFIMVQLPETTDKKSEAYKAGYENMAEIGKDRIRRAGEKIKEDLKEKYKAASDDERKEMKHPDELDIGFKVFKLDSSNIKEWHPGKYENVQQAIEDALTPYVSGRTEEDVVYEMMLKMGLDLTYPVEKIDLNGKTIYSIGYGFLMICLADKVDIVVAEKMIEIKEENNQQEFRAIFRDEGFSSDTDKTNVKETLRSAGLAEESFITL